MTKNVWESPVKNNGKMTVTGKTDVFGDHLSQCQSLHHKSYTDQSRIEPRLSWWTSTKRLSHGLFVSIMRVDLLPGQFLSAIHNPATLKPLHCTASGFSLSA
jgi:hypothetical protein